MDKYKRNLNNLDFLKFSGYIEDLIVKTQNFCSHVQEDHQKHLKNQKKLSIYEKFQGLDKLSSVDLERLEKHLSKGVDLVKNERIRRKYEKQIALLQSKIMNSSKENETNSLKSENIKQNVDKFKELYDDLFQFLNKFTYFKAEIDLLKENSNKKCNKITSTVKKTRHFSLGLLNFEETIEKDVTNNQENNNLNDNNNENLATKVSSFGEEELNNLNNIIKNKENLENNSNINNNIDKINAINEILSSQQLEREITQKCKKIANLTTEINNFNEEHSPDFSFKSYIHPSNLNKTIEKTNENINLSFDQSKKLKNLKRKAVKNTSISGVAFAESIDFSFHEEDHAENEENEERMLKSANDISQFRMGENLYLKKLRKQMLKK